MSFKKQRILAYVLYIVLFFVLVFLVFKINRVYDQNGQYARILSVETWLLKKWQWSGGLRNNLAPNSSGREVSLLQEMLSQDSAEYQKPGSSGYYGSVTSSAVSNFQREYGLKETGIVDDATRVKLNEVFFTNLCPTAEDSYPDFTMRKVTKDFLLPENYVPPGLFDITDKIKSLNVQCVRSDIVPYLADMFASAKKDGIILAVSSSFRKIEVQEYLYDLWTRTHGYEPVDGIAPPGGSEHQLGTTVDLTDSSIGFASASAKFAQGKGFKWLEEHAHEYGFSLSFQEGKKEITGFKYEPWHWRFLGVALATYLHEHNLSFNEMEFDQDGFVIFDKTP